MNAKGVTDGNKWYQLPLTDEQRACLMKDIDDYFQCEGLSATGQCYHETVVVLTLLLCCNAFAGTRLAVFRGAPLIRVGEGTVVYKPFVDESWLYRNEPPERGGLGDLQGPDFRELTDLSELFACCQSGKGRTDWQCDKELLRTKAGLLCLHPWGRLSDDGNIRERIGIPIVPEHIWTWPSELCGSCHCSYKRDYPVVYVR